MNLFFVQLWNRRFINQLLSRIIGLISFSFPYNSIILSSDERIICFVDLKLIAHNSESVQFMLLVLITLVNASNLWIDDYLNIHVSFFDILITNARMKKSITFFIELNKPNDRPNQYSVVNVVVVVLIIEKKPRCKWIYAFYHFVFHSKCVKCHVIRQRSPIHFQSNTFCSYLAIFNIFFSALFFLPPSFHCLFDSYHRRKWFCSLRCIVDDAFCTFKKGEEKKSHLYVHVLWVSITHKYMYWTQSLRMGCGIFTMQSKTKQNKTDKREKKYTWNIHFPCSKHRHQAKEICV